MASNNKKTRLLFLNHASVLVQCGGAFLLTDPWFQRPAFGSWLPSPPPFVHPCYLVALARAAESFAILVSHGHDDHLDDDLLRLFAPGTKVVTADYAAPSVRARVRAAGLSDCIAAPAAGIQLGPFRIRSFIEPAFSPDDAIYSIATEDAVLVHANDCWRPLGGEEIAIIAGEVATVPPGRTLYMSQTNSASGYPLTYPELSVDEQARHLDQKVGSMVVGGMENAAMVGIGKFLSYAGYSAVFHKHEPRFLDQAINPAPYELRRRYGARLPQGVELLDMMPGDTFDFETLTPGLLGTRPDATLLARASADFYHAYGVVERCDSYKPALPIDRDGLLRDLEAFLTEFDAFVRRKTAEGMHASAVGKVFAVELDGTGVRRAVKFGSGICSGDDFNKLMLVDAQLMRRVLDREILFENLYTGYGARFIRRPKDQYNRDIISFLVMFSYVFKRQVPQTLKRQVETAAGLSG